MSTHEKSHVLTQHLYCKGFVRWLAIGVYVFLLVVIAHVPQLNFLPIEWQSQSIKITWMMMRVMLLCGCVTAIVLRQNSVRTHVILTTLIGIIGFWGIWGLEHYLLAPIHPTLDHQPKPNQIVKQTSSSSCAPAALVTVLNQWNIYTSEADIAKLAHTSRVGTSMPQLILAARHLGLDGVVIQPSWETMTLINRPGILSVWVNDGDRRLPHAVALLGMSHDSAIIADPADGQAFQIKRKALEKIWRHEYLPIFKPEDIVLSEQQVVEYLVQQQALETYRTSHHKRQFLRTSSIGWTFSGWQYRNDTSNAIAHDLHQFQRQLRGIKATGQLDPRTMLALQGPFIQDSPTLLQLFDTPKSVTEFHRPS